LVSAEHIDAARFIPSTKLARVSESTRMIEHTSFVLFSETWGLTVSPDV
jgi:hypothetical protein